MAEQTPFLSAHCRAGRALLDMTQQQLAASANVGVMTVKRFEAGKDVRAAQAGAIRAVLERAGVTLLGPTAELGGEASKVGVVMDRSGAKDV